MTLSLTLPKAWSAFSKNKRLLLFVVLLEFFLLFVLFKIYMQFFIPTQDVFTDISAMMQEKMSSLADEDLYKVEGLLFEDADFMALYHRLIYLWLGMLVIMSAATVLFKAPLWHIAHKSILKSIPLKSLGKTYFLMVFWWFVGASIIFAYASVSSSFFEEPGFIIKALLTLTLLILCYFADVSFSLVPARQTFKKTFILGIKSAKAIVPAFLVNSVIAFNALALPFIWATKVSQSMWGVAALAALLAFITFPALAFTRVHMIISMSRTTSIK